MSISQSPCPCSNSSIDDVYQSPIMLSYNDDNILFTQSNIYTYLDEVESQYNPETKHWEVDNDVYIKNNGIQYKLIQFHMHQRCEHIINSEIFQLEIHFVFNGNNNKSILVLGFLAKIGQTSDIIKSIIYDEPFYIPDFYKYFTYPGSLTTKPFNINVNWNVIDEFLYISLDDLKLLKEKSLNYRQIYNRNGRDIMYVNNN